MAWARLDDRRHENAKLRRAGLEAAGLDAYGITYCSANLTDGFLDTAVVQYLATVRHWRRLADSLATEGRWTRDDELDGWWIVNYLEFNPSRDSVLVDREDKSRRGKAGADARWNASGHASRMQDASRPHSPSIGTEMPPTRTHPVGINPPTPRDAFVEKFADVWVRHSEGRGGVKSQTALKAWVLKTWGPWAYERFEANPNARPETLVDRAKALGMPEEAS